MNKPPILRTPASFLTAFLLLCYRCVSNCDFFFSVPLEQSCYQYTPPPLMALNRSRFGSVYVFLYWQIQLWIFQFQSRLIFFFSVLFALLPLKTTNRSCTSHFEAGAGERSITLSNRMIIFGLKTRKLKRLKWLRKSASSNIWGQ